MHKNDEGTYIVVFFDKHGRHLKDHDILCNNSYTSIETGKKTVTLEEEPFSFLVRRNIYNSIDRGWSPN